MSREVLLQFAPLIGGAVLLLVCCISIIISGISAANAGGAALGALMFAVPTLTNFGLETPVFKITGQRIQDQVVVQGAELKRDLSDIKLALEAMAKQTGGPAAATVANAVSPTKQPAQLVLIFYVAEQKDVALKLQNYLLQNGYAANAVKTDFSELKDERREKEGTVRVAYTSKSQSAEQKVSAELKSKFPELTRVVESKNDNLTAADLQIQMF